MILVGYGSTKARDLRKVPVDQNPRDSPRACLRLATQAPTDIDAKNRKDFVSFINLEVWNLRNKNYSNANYIFNTFHRYLHSNFIGNF
jgi:hypothetical protein